MVRTQIAAIDINDMAKGVKIGTLTVKVTGHRRFKFRSWLTIKLCELAALVCPAHIGIVVENDG